jgi:hypothetical protein
MTLPGSWGSGGGIPLGSMCPVVRVVSGRAGGTEDCIEGPSPLVGLYPAHNHECGPTEEGGSDSRHTHFHAETTGPADSRPPGYFRAVAVDFDGTLAEGTSDPTRSARSPSVNVPLLFLGSFTMPGARRRSLLADIPNDGRRLPHHLPPGFP